MNQRPRTVRTLLAALALAAVPVFAFQSAALQKPPKITGNSVVKPASTPGRFQPFETSAVFTPKAPASAHGALFGQAQFDFTTDQIRIVQNEQGNFVAVKVMVPHANRPVTFEWEFLGPATGKHKFFMSVGEPETPPKLGNKLLTNQSIETRGLRQRLTITATPSKAGWMEASAGPSSVGSIVEFVSVTVKQ